MENTRHTLIQQLKNQHDHRAWGTFSETYGGYIYSVLRKLSIQHDDAEDLQQDILLQLWKKLPDFNYQPRKAKFRTWLYTVVKNAAFRHLQKQSNKQQLLQRYFKDNQEPSKQQENSPELDHLFQSEWQSYITHLAMQQVKQSFTAQSIEIFEKNLKGHSSAELAEEYQLKPNTINRIKNRVKERMILEVAELREHLE